MARKTANVLVVWFLVLGLALPVTLPAEDSGAAPADGGGQPQFRVEQLDQMLAPIALYPDSLLAQILAASTYPLEVVQAARFLQENSSLSGDALSSAAKDKDWDPSVKAMLQFPDVLKMMNDKLDWTQDLGDAFLGQQKDVMDSVQRLRAKAQDSGNLKSTKEQVVREEPDTQVIVIEPSSPDVVYVPAYDPTVVYGSWWYPSYPPYPYYPYGWVPGAAAFGFMAGVAIGAAWGGWGCWGCNWHGGCVNVNVNNFNNFTHNNYNNWNKYQKNGGGNRNQNWTHDASHRRGDPYRDRNTAQKFGQGDRYRGSDKLGQSGLDRSKDFRGSNWSGDRGYGRGGDRGYDRGGGSNRGGDRAGTRDMDRGGGRDFDRGGGSRDFDRGSGGRDRSSAFDGAGRGGADRSASARGSSSRGGGYGGGGRSYSGGGRSSGGFSGGGRGGGGGRRR